MDEITIRDIASRAGVGTATVSRVLNKSGYVSAKTRIRIESAIEELGYVPSAAARTLPTKKTGVVALVIPELGNPFFYKIITGAASVLERAGMHLFLSSTDNVVERDKAALYAIRQLRVEGLLYTPAAEYNERARTEIRKALTAIGPVVLIDREIEGSGVDGVYSDNEGGAYLCAKALIDAGHRHIGIVNGDLSLKIGRERFAGFQRALREASLPLRKDDNLPGNFSECAAYGATRARLAAGDFPTAFFASNNLSAHGFLRAVHEAGMRIPQDVGFIGFDPIEGTDIVGVRFSSLERDEQGIGRDAACLLLERMASPQMAQRRMVLSSAVHLTGSEQFFPR